MSAENAANLGFFETQRAAKKKREDDYAAAVAAMRESTARLPSDISEDTGEASVGASVPLLHGMSPNAWATKTLEIIEGLKKENPRNTQLLTEVLINTARYIDHEQDKKANPNLENNPTILANYEATRKKVDMVGLKFSALSFALTGLPPVVLLGGILGSVLLAVAFPALVIPVVFIAPFIILAVTFESMKPCKVTDTMSDSWIGLEKDLNQTKLSFGR